MIKTKDTRCTETLKARLERQLEELQFESYCDQQSNDRYWSDGSWAAHDRKANEIRMELQRIAQDEWGRV